MTNNRTARTFTLKDGRTLGFAEYGEPDGLPLFAFHGTPGSRLDAGMIDEAVFARHNIRVICPDRPGIGLSTFQRGRAILDWSADVCALADALGIDRFAVMGVSGGGPYAAVCAYQIPERLTSAALVCGVAPLSLPGMMDSMGSNKMFFVLNARFPWLGKQFVRLMASATDRKKFMKNVIPTLPAPDQAAAADPRFAQAFFDTFRQSVRQGPGGVAWDARLVGKPWGFDVGAIQMPVSIWQGEVDRNVPLAMGRYYAQTIPNARPHFLPREGHLSTFICHIDAIFKEVKGNVSMR